MTRRGTKAEVAIVTMVAFGLIIISAAVVKETPNSYVCVLGALSLFSLFLGRWLNGRLLGIFIGDRNLMSLSRLQMVVWTVLILAAYLTICLRPVHNGVAAPLMINVDWHLLALMGISTVSLIGSPVLLGNKIQKEAHSDAVKKAADQLKEDPLEIRQNCCGTLYLNKSVNDASFADIFQGDEIGNTAYIDAAKLQMFLFTFIGLIVYAAALLQMFSSKTYSEMPSISDGWIALLGISHAGYLTSKTSDHTQTT